MPATLQFGGSTSSLGNPETFILPPIQWGRPDVLFTPAYWAYQVSGTTTVSSGGHRLGESLLEECAACMLGGHGIPADVGLAAFEMIRDSGLLSRGCVNADHIHDALSQPIDLPDGRVVKYRFARQKSMYLAALLHGFTDPPDEVSPRSIRNWLTRFPGIGLKTASWVARNWYDADDVAVIDIHIHRAGLLAGFFKEADRLPRDYLSMERRFLSFAFAIGTRPSVLDAVIWRQMRQAPTLVQRSLVG